MPTSKGHQAKSTEQHKKQGTYRADRHANRADSFLPALDCAPPPRGMRKPGKDLWKKLTAAYEGRLAPPVLESLRQYCDCWVAYLLVAPRYIKDPLDKDTARAYKQAFDCLERMGRKWGYSPADLAGVQLPPPGAKAEDPFEAWLQRQGNN